MRTTQQIGRWFVGLVTLALVLIGTANAVRSQPQRADSALPAALDKFVYLPLTASSPTNDWLQFNGDPQHSGSTAAETRLTAGNVGSLTQLFQVPLPAVADGAPVYLSAVSTTLGIKNVVYVTTKDGRIVALDADTGSTIWSKQTAGVQYTTSSPAIDPNRQFVYSYGLDGKAHKYHVGDGSEVLSNDWPETATLKPEVEKGSPPLTMATANGTFAPASYHWGDTVFSLNPDGTGANGNPLNSYTPVNYQQLQDTDQDIGSTNIAILPTAIASTVSHLAVQGGKDARLRLIDLDTMSGLGGPGLTGGEVFSMSVPQGGEVLTAIAVWVDPVDQSTWAFVANGNGISGLQVTYTGTHVPQLTTRWQKPAGGTSPVVANGVVFYAGSNNIHALDPKTGNELWPDTTYVGGIHWESPIVVNGVVYITDEKAQLTAYAR